jgi:hypothetical protein
MTITTVGSSTAFGQATASGSIQGTVFDKSEAAVAALKLLSPTRLLELLAQSPPAIPEPSASICSPPALTLSRFSKNGFSTVTQTLELLVGQTATTNSGP